MLLRHPLKSPFIYKEHDSTLWNGESALRKHSNGVSGGRAVLESVLRDLPTDARKLELIVPDAAYRRRTIISNFLVPKSEVAAGLQGPARQTPKPPKQHCG